MHVKTGKKKKKKKARKEVGEQKKGERGKVEWRGIGRIRTLAL